MDKHGVHTKYHMVKSHEIGHHAYLIVYLLFVGIIVSVLKKCINLKLSAKLGKATSLAQEKTLKIMAINVCYLHRFLSGLKDLRRHEKRLNMTHI